MATKAQIAAKKARGRAALRKEAVKLRKARARVLNLVRRAHAALHPTKTSLRWIGPIDARPVLEQLDKAAGEMLTEEAAALTRKRERKAAKKARACRT